MTFRAAVFYAIAATAVPSAASEGLADAAWYYCSAIDVNTAAVNSCSATHPEMSVALAEAHEAWKAKYGGKAAAAATKCDAEFRERTKAESISWETVRAKFETAKAAFIAQTESSGASSDPEFCRAVLSRLEKSPNEFEDKFWSRP